MNTVRTIKHGRVSVACFLVLFLLFMIGTVAFIGNRCQTDDIKIKVNEYDQVTGVWITDAGEEVSFPGSISIGEEGIHSLTCTLPSNIEECDSIVYDAHYCGQKVYVDGELIYSYAENPILPFGDTRGNAKILIPLSPEYAGKQLTIEWINPFGTNDTNIAGFFFGPAGEFKFALLYENIWRIIMAAAIASIALTMLLFGISHLITQSSEASTFTFFYFAFLAFSVSTWILSDVSIVQLFTSKTVLGQYVAFLSLICIGSFDMGLCACLLPRRVAHFHGAESIGYILAFLYFILYVANIADPVVMMVPICVYGVFCVVFATTLCGIEFKRNHIAKVLFVGQVILTSGVFTALAMLANDPMKSNSMWPIVGSYTCYLVLLFLLLMHYEQSLLARSNKSGAYWKMAYTDQLTGIANRAALEQIFDALEERRSEEHEIMFFMADLNNLKQTNDSLGHDAGDVLIRAAADCFGTVFYKDSPDGKSMLSFRLGGDEFAAIVVDSNQPPEYYYEKLDEQLRQKRKAGVNVSIAIGHAICKYPTDGLNLRNGLYRAADHMMYERKLEMKNDPR